MGSLFSSPSVPSVSPVSYVPTTTVVQRTATTTAKPKTTTTTTQPSEKEDAVKDIIRKSSRGRSSTIQTSFRGVLGETNALVPKRKSLLGE